jgi:uncharacterized protein (DUF1778 family)
LTAKRACLTLRVPVREKEIWQKVAKAVGEDLNEFARKAVRLRVQAVQSKGGSPWDDLLESVSTDAPPATNAAVRKAMRARRSHARRRASPMIAPE